MRTFAIGTAAVVLAAGIGSGLFAPTPSAVPGAPAGYRNAEVNVPLATVQQARRQFLGTWKLVKVSARTPAGQVLYPFGKDAQGVLTYSADGTMSAGLWKANRTPFAVNDQQKGTAAEYAAAVQSVIAYFGTFDVDSRAGSVSHHVRQSIFPNWTATTQTRFYRFGNHDRRLTLTTPPITMGGSANVLTVVWER